MGWGLAKKSSRLCGAFCRSTPLRESGSPPRLQTRYGETGPLLRDERGFHVTGIGDNGLAEFGAVEHRRGCSFSRGAIRCAASPRRLYRVRDPIYARRGAHG